MAKPPSLRQELLMFGFMRDYCKDIDKELPSDDLIRLFAAWVALIDRWDKEKCHSGVEIVSKLATICKTIVPLGAVTCIGESVIKKGEKNTWKLKVNSSYVMAGIIDDEIVRTMQDIDDFTAEYCGGYGLSLGYGIRFNDKFDFPQGDNFHYAQQFKLHSVVGDSIGIVFEMELDLTQKENENGILRFVIDDKHNKGIDTIETVGKYSNICFDTIDIDKKYRLAVDIGGKIDKTVELLTE